jgi:hypothetical protein
MTGESGGDGDDDWDQSPEDVLKPAQQQTNLTSKLSAVEQQMAMFRRRMLEHTVSGIPDDVARSPSEESLWFPPSDDEVPSRDQGIDQPDEIHDEEYQRSGASRAKGKGVHRPGPLPDEACRKAQEFGDGVMQHLKELAMQYGKPVQRILEEAGLKKLATRGEQRWNLHQKWYAFCHPITEDGKYSAFQLSRFLIYPPTRECQGLPSKTKRALRNARR